MADSEDRLQRLEAEIERRLLERFAGLRDEFDRLRLESDRRWAGFLSRFDQDFKGLVPSELIHAPEPEPKLPATTEGAGLLSIEVARSLDDAGNQVEALHRFLDLCRRHASRAALLISKTGGFAVWKATGFSDNGGNDEATRRVTLPMDGGPLSRVLDGVPFRLSADNEISLRLGAGDVAAAVLVPMVVKEKVSGAVYADATRADASRFDAESIAFLTFLAGLFVDRLAGRKLKPAPPLRELEEPGAPPRAEEMRAPTPTAPPFEAPAPPRSGARESFGTKILASSAEMAEPSVASPPRASSESIPMPPPARPSRPEAPPPEPPRGAMRPTPAEAEIRPIPVYEEEPALAYEPEAAPPPPARPEPPPPPPPPAEPPPPPPAPEIRAEPVSPMRPTTARRLAGPLAPPEGDERKEEARRFAKLLVSEIKLYNEKAVVDGRQHGNLYERLKEDIDRSRQMYDERIPEDVRASSNFFYEELVRILADGRAEALGI